MHPQTIESRFCRLEVPSNWTLSPGVGGFHADLKRSAVVTENWLESPTPAAAYAETQHRYIKENNPEIELIEQKELPLQNLGDCHWSAFFLAMPNGTKARQEQITLVNGYIACTLTLTALAGDDEAWSKIYPSIYRSLHFTALDWASKMRREPLTLTSPATHGTTVEVRAPLLQICFHSSSSWSFDPTGGFLRSTTGAVIFMRRSNLPSHEPESLFADSLAANLRASFTPSRWDKGETPSGYTFWAVESKAHFKATWGPGEKLVVRQAFLQDESTLEIRLEAREDDTEALSAFEAVVSTYTLLPPSERQLQVQEPWLNLTLTGPWQEADRGVFLRESEPPIFLTVQQLSVSRDLPSYSATATAAFRSRPDVQTIVREESLEGIWKGHEAHRYSIDFVNQSSQTMSLRASWLASRKELYEVVVLGTAGTETEETFRKSLAGFTPEAGS